MKEAVYNNEGKKIGEVVLPAEVFDLPFNGDLVHQVMVSMQSNARTPIAHTKDRSDVRGGGKKPWRQKGTGNARHGSSRSPIWKGGGVTFGPRNDKNFSRKVNKKMKSKAFCTVLSQKLRDKEIIFLDDLVFADPKTAEAKKVVTALGKEFEGFVLKKKNAALLTIPAKDEALEKSFSNFNNLTVKKLADISLIDVLSNKYLIIEEAEKSIEVLTARTK